jgi:hemerythrin
MGFLEWNDDLSVDVREIDEQHKRLIAMINSFYESVSADHRQALEMLLRDLVDYSHYHFSTEEGYMDRFGFEGIEEHKKEHRIFMVKARDMFERHKKGRLVVSVEATNFLKDWILSHIRRSDQRYAPCFKANGLS